MLVSLFCYALCSSSFPICKRDDVLDFCFLNPRYQYMHIIQIYFSVCLRQKNFHIFNNIPSAKLVLM